MYISDLHFQIVEDDSTYQWFKLINVMIITFVVVYHT